MIRYERHPASKRREVAELMRAGDLTPAEIAQATGVPYTTVCKWNQAQGWRPAQKRRFALLKAVRWSAQRLGAVARLAGAPQVDPGDVAEALGLRRDRAGELLRVCGLPERAAQGDLAPGEALRQSLRAHVARQIAEFDAALTERARPCRKGEARPPDSARTLRDLAGLKRLLDEIDAAAPPQDADPMTDLNALRDAIARRYAAMHHPPDAPGPD